MISVPVGIISAESIAARDFTSASSAINEMPSMRPPVPTNSGFGNNPGFIGQAGVGATVSGSGAIAGVVNYVLRDDFTGVEVDALGSQTSRKDYSTGSFRVTAGTHALEGRANIAINLEYSKTGSILRNERRIGILNPFAVQNFAPGVGTNGIPAQLYIQDIFIPNVSHQGTIVTSPADFGVGSLLQVGGHSVRFNDAGNALVAFDPGTTVTSIPLAVYGDDYDRKVATGRRTAMIPAVVRAGINNFTDKLPSYPTNYYGDIVGRSFFVGLNSRF